MIKEPGFFENVDFDEYRKWANWSNSELKALERCETLRKFKFRRDHPEAKDSKSLHLGRVVDSYISYLANPKDFPFEKSFIVLPKNAAKPSWNKKEENWSFEERTYKAIEKESLVSKRELITVEEYANVKEIVSEIGNGWFKDSFEKILTEGIPQPSVAWMEEEFGLAMKGRLDFYLPKSGLVIDIKTTSDPINKYAFGETVFKYFYHLQAFVYMRGLKKLGYDPKGFAFFVIQTEPPYEHVIHNTPEVALTMASKKYVELLTKLSRAIRNEEWPGFSEVEDFVVPKRFFNGEIYGN